MKWVHCRRKSKTHSYFMGHQLIFFVKISNTLGAVTLTWRASSDHSHLQKITSHRLLMKQRAHLLQSLTFCWRFNITFQNNVRFKSCTSYFFPSRNQISIEVTNLTSWNFDIRIHHCGAPIKWCVANDFFLRLLKYQGTLLYYTMKSNWHRSELSFSVHCTA